MPWLKSLTHNWTLKLAALGLAILLWTVTRADTRAREIIHGVPVQIRVDDPDWVVARGPTPDSVSISFIGPYRELFQLALARPRIVIPIDEPEDTMGLYAIREAYLRMDTDLGQTRVEDFRPDVVRVAFERVTTRVVPVAIRTTGAVPPGFTLHPEGIHADPAEVRVSGPQRRIAQIDSVPLEPVNLSRIMGPSAVRVDVNRSALPRDLIVSPGEVRLYVPIMNVPPVDTVVRRDTVPPTVPPDTVPPRQESGA